MQMHHASQVSTFTTPVAIAGAPAAPIPFPLPRDRSTEFGFGPFANHRDRTQPTTSNRVAVQFSKVERSMSALPPKFVRNADARSFLDLNQSIISCLAGISFLKSEKERRLFNAS
jgi:hypothetical protein